MRRSKKTSKLHVNALCAWNSPVTGEFPHKGPVTRKMFPCDDVIMKPCWIMESIRWQIIRVLSTLVTFDRKWWVTGIVNAFCITKPLCAESIHPFISIYSSQSVNNTENWCAPLVLIKTRCRTNFRIMDDLWDNLTVMWRHYYDFSRCAWPQCNWPSTYYDFNWQVRIRHGSQRNGNVCGAYRKSFHPRHVLPMDKTIGNYWRKTYGNLDNIIVPLEVLMLSLQWRHNGRDGVSNHQPHDCLLNRLFRHRSKKTSITRVTGLCVGNSLGTGELPTQMASNAENVSIWWRYHVLKYVNTFAIKLSLHIIENIQ